MPDNQTAAGEDVADNFQFILHTDEGLTESTEPFLFGLIVHSDWYNPFYVLKWNWIETTAILYLEEKNNAEKKAY